jgi:hypothetical protein
MRALLGIVLLTAVPLGAARAIDLKSLSQPVAAACMPCQAKCPKCLNTGRFPNVEACIQDCNARGNPSVNATCGAFKRC